MSGYSDAEVAQASAEYWGFVQAEAARSLDVEGVPFTVGEVDFIQDTLDELIHSTRWGQSQTEQEMTRQILHKINAFRLGGYEEEGDEQ